MIAFLNSVGNSWLEFFIIFELQNSMFILLILGLLFLFRNYPAKFRKQLTILGLFKTLIPPVLTMSFLTGGTVISGTMPVFFLPELAVGTSTNFSLSYINPAGILFLFWLSGVVSIFLISVYNVMQFRRQIRRSKKVKLHDFHIPEKTNIYFDDLIKSPIVYDCFSPKIILPEDWKALEKRMQYSILLHEMNHIKNGDLWLNTVKVLSLMFHFFNPLHWVLLHYFELFTEMACDDRTVQESGINKEEYNELILKAAEAITLPQYISKALGFSRAFQLLRQRIKYQLNPKEIKDMKRSTTLRLTVLILMVLIIIPFSWQCSKQQEEKTVSPAAVQEKNERVLVDENGVYAYYAVDKKPEMVSKAKPLYPEDARKAGIEGTVVVIITIDENGQVIEAVPLEEAPMRGPNGENLGMKKANHILELEPAAIEAAKKCTFIPAEYNGQPVKVKMAIPFRFRLH